MALQCLKGTAAIQDTQSQLDVLNEKVRYLSERLEALYRVTKQVAEHEARQHTAKLVLLNQSVLVPEHDYRWDCGQLKLTCTVQPEDIVRVVTLDGAQIRCLPHQELL